MAIKLSSTFICNIWFECQEANETPDTEASSLCHVVNRMHRQWCMQGVTGRRASYTHTECHIDLGITFLTCVLSYSFRDMLYMGGGEALDN